MSFSCSILILISIFKQALYFAPFLFAFINYSCNLSSLLNCLYSCSLNSCARLEERLIVNSSFALSFSKMPIDSSNLWLLAFSYASTPFLINWARSKYLARTNMISFLRSLKSLFSYRKRIESLNYFKSLYFIFSASSLKIFRNDKQNESITLRADFMLDFWDCTRASLYYFLFLRARAIWITSIEFMELSQKPVSDRFVSIRWNKFISSNSGSAYSSLSDSFEKSMQKSTKTS